MTEAERLRDEFDVRVRATIETRLPFGWRASRDGAVLRVRTGHRGLAFTTGMRDHSGDGVARAVDRTLEFFAGEPFEWKTYAHDHATLVPTLHERGFRPEPTETVLLGPVERFTDAGEPPEGVHLRPVHARGDLERVAALESAVWEEDWSWLADDLADRIASSPEDVAVWVAEADGEAVSAAWFVVLPGTGFAGLWGGSTVAAWRHRGVYRSLVAQRARAAARLGVRTLWVDASEDSRPVLERLGMVAVTSTTPWISPG